MVLMYFQYYFPSPPFGGDVSVVLVICTTHISGILQFLQILRFIKFNRNISLQLLLYFRDNLRLDTRVATQYLNVMWRSGQHSCLMSAGCGFALWMVLHNLIQRQDPINDCIIFHAAWEDFLIFLRQQRVGHAHSSESVCLV